MKKGWSIEKLGSLAKIIYGYTEKASFEQVGPKFLRITDIQDDGVNWNSVPYCKIDEKDLEKYKLSSGDILFARTGATTGKSYLVNDPPYSIFASYLIKVHTIHKGLLPKYLFLYFQTQTYWNVVNAGIVGSAQGGFNASKLSELVIPLPPLPEQKRIVAILDEAFSAVAKAKANAEQNLKNAKELFESYLQSVFENKGDDWEEKFLEEVTDEKCTLSYGVVQPGEEYSDGLPIVRPTDLVKRFISLNNLKLIDPKLADGYARTKLIGDEILLCVRGNTGIVSVATTELKGGNVTRGIVPIRFRQNVVSQSFGYYLLTSSYIQKQIKSKTYGTALMQINIGDLRKVMSPYPPLSTQRIIVSKLDALSAETKKLESIYQQKISDLEELKKTILQKAFNGELNLDRVAV